MQHDSVVGWSRLGLGPNVRGEGVWGSVNKVEMIRSVKADFICVSTCVGSSKALLNKRSYPVSSIIA